MTRARWAAAAVATAAGPLLMTPAAPALADEVTVTPNRVRPGQQVDIKAKRCEGPAFASSAAFDIDVELTEVSSGTVTGTARIDRSTAPGTDQVEVDCQGNDKTRLGWFRVISGPGPHTGGGGLALATEHTAADDGGPPAWLVGLGAAGLAGCGAALLAHRRRAARRG